MSLTQFFRALKDHYFILSNSMLIKSRKDIKEVEKFRTLRVEENIKKRREEKGLITVQETMNESDPNRTHTGNFTPTKTKLYKDTQDVILEEQSEKDDSFSSLL